MKITDIRNLLERLEQCDWEMEFSDDEADASVMEVYLSGMLENASGEIGALYAFLDYVEIEETKGRGLAVLFDETYKGNGRDKGRLVREYFTDQDGDDLQALAQDRLMGDYFQWEDYINDQRPDLHFQQVGSDFYLFEDE